MGDTVYRLIASDMDETFLGERHRIPEANLAALERLKELGVLFVPSSGRPYRSIVANFTHLDPTLMEGTYVISYNGAFINRYGDERPLVSTTIDRESVEKLYAYGLAHRIPMHIYTASGTFYVQFIPEQEWEVIHDIEGIVRLPDEQADLSFAGNDGLVKLLYLNFDFDALKTFAPAVMEELELDPARVAYTFSSNRYAEFVPAGIDKGTGLKRLAEMLDIDIRDTIAMGDSANDLGMIEAAGLGVGVANVTDDARGACDLVLDTDADHGALDELVRRVIEPEHR